MKKQVFKRVVIALFVIFAFVQVFFLTSCGIEEVNIESMVLDKESPNEFVIGQFDMSDYQFVITYRDGTKKTISLTEDMLSDEDYLKTFHEGTYELEAKYLNVSCTFTVTAKKYTFNVESLKNDTVTYDGLPHGLTVEDPLPEGTTIVYPDGNEYVDAGTYTVTALLVNSYYVTGSVSGTLVIEPATYDMSGIEFNDVVYTYDGNPKTISVSGNIPKDLDIYYSMGKIDTNQVTEASDTPYVFTAHFDAGGNYLPIEDMTATMTINKGVYDMSEVQFVDKEVVYDGAYKSLTISNLKAIPKGVTVKYTNNEQKNAGIYTAVAHFSGDSINYEPIPDMTATLTIQKGTIDLSSVYFDNESFTYDKAAHYVTYSGELPRGVSFNGYQYYEADEDGNILEMVEAMINVGYYKVRAYFSYSDKKNYESIDPLETFVEITKADITGAQFNDVTVSYDGFSHSIYVTNLPSGVDVTYTNNAQKEVGEYEVNATFSFASGSLAERNYNELSSMNAKLTITKADFGNSLQDVNLEYTGKKFGYSITDTYGKNGTYLGKKIALTGDGELIEGAERTEYLPQGVSIFFTYDNDSSVKVSFDGVTDPTSILLYANYYTEDLEIANSCYEHYNTSTPYLSNATINGEIKQVYILAQKSFVFNVTKREYIPTFLNQYTTYTGSDITVSIDTDTDTNNPNYPNLSFASGYTTTGGIYKNNTQLNPGIYQGTVDIKLSDTALKYYKEPSTFTFNYAILPESGQELFDPGIDNIVEDNYDESILLYEYAFDVEMPKGMTISYTYGTEITKPGSYPILITISYLDDNDDRIECDADVARKYYTLPDGYTLTDTGYSRIITYKINKKLYDLTFDAEYYYNGNAYVPTCTNKPDWVSITYFDKDDELKTEKINDDDYVLVVPGTYHLTAYCKIVDSHNAEYYTVNSAIQLDMVIHKGYYTDYKIVGDTVKYDGEYHNITVENLPDGITYETSLGLGRKDVGVYEDIIIYFTNNSLYYEDLDNVKLTMTIEKNSVALGSLEAYCKTSGNKTVKQFTTLKEILNDYVDLTGATVEFTCDYYDKNNVIYPDTYTTRHGSSTKTNDFEFAETTTSSEFVLCTFTINLSDGYVFDDENESTTFNGSITVYINESVKIDTAPLSAINDYKEVSVSQYSTLSELISNYLKVENSDCYMINTWSANYYNAIVSYPSEYILAHANSKTYFAQKGSNDYVFELNTWDERYCLVEYTLAVNGDYCFFENGESSQSYTGIVKCKVDQNITKVDDYFLTKEITDNGFNVNKYAYLEDYLGDLIDTRYVTIEAKAYDKDNQELAKTNDKILLNNINNTDNFTMDLSVKIGDGIIGFINSNENEIKFEKKKMISDEATLIDIRTLYAIPIGKSERHELVFEQYIQPGESAIKSGLLNMIFDNTYFSYELYYNDGTIVRDFNAGKIVSIEKTTEPGEEAIVKWTFVAKDGYYFITDDTKERTDIYHIELNFSVSPVEIIDTTALSLLEENTIEVEQYSDISTSVNELNEIITKTGGKVVISWNGNYYDGTEKLETGLKVENASTFNGIFDLATSDSMYFNATITLKFNENSGYVFDNLGREFKFTLRYEVKNRTAFDEPKLTEMNNGTYDIKTATTIQGFINSLSLNSNLVLNEWTVQYDTDKVETGSLISMFTFTEKTTYQVTIKFTTKTGTCVLKDGLGLTEITVTFVAYVYDEYATTFKLKQISYVEDMIQVDNKQIYQMASLTKITDDLFSDEVAFDGAIYYAEGTNEMQVLDDTVIVSTPGTYNYQFKVQTKCSEPYTHYVIKDSNGNILAYYNNQNDVKKGELKFVVQVEVLAPTIIDLDTPASGYDYGYNYMWTNFEINKSYAPKILFNWGVPTGSEVVEVKVNEHVLTSEELASTATYDTYNFEESTISITLKAKYGYAFDADCTTEKTFVYNNKKCSTSTVDLKAFLSQANTEIYGERLGGFDKCLIAVKNNAYALLGYSPYSTLSQFNGTFKYAYSVWSTDGKKLKNTSEWASTDEEIKKLDEYIRAYTYYIVKVDYVFKGNNDLPVYYETNDPWLKRDVTSYYYMYIVPSNLGVKITQSSSNKAYLLSDFSYVQAGATYSDALGAYATSLYSYIYLYTTDYGDTYTSYNRTRVTYYKTSVTTLDNVTFMKDFNFTYGPYSIYNRYYIEIGYCFALWVVAN